MSKKAKSPESSRKENLKWTEEMDNVFIDAMLEQQSRGFRVDGTFTSAAYKNMLTVCAQTFGVALTKGHLKNRIKTLKSNYNTCHELFKNKSGISWSSETKMFEADNQVWDELIVANPLIRKWRSTIIHNYDKLEALFSKDRAIGGMSNTCKEFMKTWGKESEDREAISLLSASHDTPCEDADETSPADVPPLPLLRGTIGDSTSSKSSKRKYTFTFQEAALLRLDDTNEKLNEIVNCMKQANESISKQFDPDCEEKEYTEKEIYEELKKIGVPRHRIARAYVALGKSKEKTRLFFSAPDEVRYEVLNEIMND